MSREARKIFCTRETMLEQLHACRGPNGLSASDNTGRFGGKLFVRDTKHVVRDVMHLPGLASFCRNMFSAVAQWQGTECNETTNELPNAMPHEVFRQFIGGIGVSHEHIERAETTTKKWGIQLNVHPEYGRYYVTYNSSDAAPLYLIALAEYCQLYGRHVLSDVFKHQLTGSNRTVAQAAHRCVEFLLDGIKTGETAGHGLYAVPNTNPLQTSPSGVMRDGFDAYYHADGKPVNYSLVAYIENQALVYEALHVAADILFMDDLDAARWRGVAEELRRRTVEKLWITDEAFFAAAHDSSGPVAMRSSAAFELLDGPFFVGLPDGPEYVRALVERLYSQEFMTPVGVRMTSRAHRLLEGDYWAYQGVRAVWPVTTNTITNGLRYWGMPQLAYDLGVRRLIGGLNRLGHATELMYVDDVSGRPLFHPEMITTLSPQYRRVAYPAELGQTTQSWTVSAVLRQLSQQSKTSLGVAAWQTVLDQKVASAARNFPTADHIPHLHMPIDLEHGKILKRRRAEQLGYAA